MNTISNPQKSVTNEYFCTSLTSLAQICIVVLTQWYFDVISLRTLRLLRNKHKLAELCNRMSMRRREPRDEVRGTCQLKFRD